MAPIPARDGCLQGKVFGLTGELPRKPLEAAIKSQGATVSAIIHKRVSFVLCTADAVKYSTQKVRKALKHGIPLVSQDFIAACALVGHAVDHSPFLQAPKPESQASPSNGAKQAKPRALETPVAAAPLGSGGDSAPNPAGISVPAAGKLCAEEASGESSKKKRRRRLEESEPTRRPGGGEGGAGEEDSGGGSGLRSGNGGGGGGGHAGEPKERKKKKEQKEKKPKKDQKETKEKETKEKEKKEKKEKKKEKKEKREKKEIEAQKKIEKEKKGNEEEISEKKEKKKDKKKKRRKVAASENDNE